jgi:murein DD-endopeptidase MepM/ murein hydrolase activator NlpD
MQILITHSNMSRTRVICVSKLQLIAVSAGLLLAMILVSGTVYHFVFLKAAREGWPVVSSLMKLIVRDEFAQRDRYVRENLDALAQRLGQLQARLVKLDAISERVSGLAGVTAESLVPATTAAPAPGSPGPRPAAPLTPAAAPVKPAAAPVKPSPPPTVLQGGSNRPAQGGPFIPLDTPRPLSPQPSMQELGDWASALEVQVEHRGDVFTFIESRLLESRLARLMIPSTIPVQRPMTSGFGFRSDPFTGRAALHTGLDFPADIGTPVVAAAGGVVASVETHYQYGNLIEIDHGNGLGTRYAHLSKRLVAAGEIVKRGQLIAEVGNSGRSTGPHLHFEVLIDGVPQNPSRFLNAAAHNAALASAAAGPTGGHALAPRPQHTGAADVRPGAAPNPPARAP